MTGGIRTCARSLLEPGTCCVNGCTATAERAVLVDEYEGPVEHARCPSHEWTLSEEVLGSKPLVWNPAWGPSP